MSYLLEDSKMAKFKPRQQQKENSNQANPAKKSQKTERLPVKRQSNPLFRPSMMGSPAPSDMPLNPNRILFLQRTIGHRAVSRLIQAKLKIGRPNDRYEQEADRVAQQVMRMPIPKENQGQPGKPQNVVQKKASAIGQTIEGMADSVEGEERALAQNVSHSGQPMIQLATAWKNGAVHETINLAAMVLNGSPTPITWHMLNGTKMTTAAAATGAINSPTVSTSKSGATWKAKVTTVPLNTGSFDETVLAKGPWNQVAPKATVGTAMGLAVCSGKGNSTFRAKGDPNDNHVYTANRGHEDHHANDHKAAFNAKIGTWDTKVTTAKNKGTEFAGAKAADATANLWAALGGTPAGVAKAYRTDGFARGGAFHLTPNGGPMSVANPQADKTCATSSVEVKNPFK